MPIDSQWQGISDVAIYSSEEDDTVIIYNPRSGETHQLNLLAYDALVCMRTPVTISELRAQMASLYQTQISEIQDQVALFIEHFDNLGLIYPIDA